MDETPALVRRGAVRHARAAVSVLFSLAMSTLLGCGGAGGGGPAAPAVDAVVAVDPVYLTPGATTAQLAWEASEGPVESYIVFESRNGSPYSFSTTSNTPSVTIAGSPGDSVQITVVAVNDSGTLSESSPPSPPMVFQPAEAQAVASITPSTAPTATATPAAEPTDAQNESNQASELAANESDTSDPSDTSEAMNEEDANEETSGQLVLAVRALLLNGDARLPDAGLSDEACSWLQARVDADIAAGVSLAGTGRENEDAIREVVWQDQAGQLFVSDGGEFLEADDLPATFRERLRLGATERFVGLSDFDGDGQGDWLLEDTATGEVWLVDEQGAESAVYGTNGGANAGASGRAGGEVRLAGHGDFDGDGRAELLWLDEASELSLSRPHMNMAADSNDSDALVLMGSATPDGVELLAIADLDGNGRDDLLARDGQGNLVMGLSAETEAGVVLEWQTGASAPGAELDLLGTVDVDEDGRAEIAWLNGEDLEIWNASQGFEQRWSL